MRTLASILFLAGAIALVGCAPLATVMPSPLATVMPSPLRTASADEQARALSLPPQGPGSLVHDAQGRLLVNIRMMDLSANGLQSLRDAGIVIKNVSEQYQQVTAFVAGADLETLANLPMVQNVQEELAPANSGGAVIPQPP